MKFERETVTLPDGSEEELVVVPLSGGRVEHAREVPAHFWTELQANNPPPPRPVKVVETALGTKEEVSPPPDDPVWIQHYLDTDAWTKEMDLRIQRIRWFVAFHRIIEVPKDWQVPEIFKTFGGVETAQEDPDRLIQYVRYEVLKTKQDKETLDAAVSGIIPESERESARALFRESSK